jgi:predicted metal-dependent hydrolase
MKGVSAQFSPVIYWPPMIDLREEAERACYGKIHPKAIEGLQLFNAGRYWQAHEALEEAWRDEAGPVRELYRGILQAAVVYFHITRQNYAGAIKVYKRSQKWLRPWPEICRGVQLGKMRRELDAVIAEVRRLGKDRLDEFDLSLLKPVVWEVNEGQIKQ